MLACHHPHSVAGATVLAGHLHPTATLYGLARDSVRLPCFAWTPGLVVLPAFGAFTGSAVDQLPPGTLRFVVQGCRSGACERTARAASEHSVPVRRPLGTHLRTSQCSTIFPSASSRKMSMPA